MKINRLRIDDFGIIRNQTLEDISPGMVVIGGPNRAGKTTFLKLLRCLGFGLKGQSNIPPPTSQYRIEGDIVLETGDSYQLYIEGLAEPRVTRIKGDIDKVESSLCLYNNLDVFTYQQLFTISLEELRRLPEGVDKKEENKLQSVLLGAGLKDIIQITPVEKELRKEAEKIGGKKGDSNVKQFKHFNSLIKEGLELREKAKEQVANYHEKQKEKKETNRRIEKIKEELEELTHTVIRLDIIKNWHQTYKKINELQQALKTPEVIEILHYKPKLSTEKIDQFIEDYQRIQKEYEERLETFRSKTHFEAIEISKAIESLTSNYKQLDSYFRQASGLKEKLQAYKREKEQALDSERRLTREANELREGFGDDLNQLITINTDHLSEDALIKYVDEYHETTREAKNAREEKEKLEKELKHLNTQLEELDAPQVDKLFKNYFKYALAFVALGGAVGLFNLLMGVLFGVVGVFGIGIYTLIKYQNTSHERVRRDDIKTEILRINELLEAEKDKEEEAGKELSKILIELDTYRSKLGLSQDVTPQLIKEQFQKIRTLKEKIETLITTQTKLNDKKTELKDELEKVYNLIDKIYDEIYSMRLQDKIDLNDIIFKGEILFIELEHLVELSEEAKELSGYEQAKKSLEEKIANELEREFVNERSLESFPENIMLSLQNQRRQIKEYKKYIEMEEELKELTNNLISSLMLDRIREAFKIDPDEKIEQQHLIEVFYSHWKMYASPEEVEKSYQEKERKEKELKEELEELKSKSQELKLELSELRTDENLQKAQGKIDEGRKMIRPLAEKYAAQNLAAFLLNEAKAMFLQEAKDSLLSEANKYLQKITGGEYKGIMPPDDLKDADFRVEYKDGDLIDTTEILSRGTKEQLFFAVRLSRIKEISPPLPVILDDTLANFDMHHLERTASLLVDLTKTHQVFVLTCHPELVQVVMDYAETPQFFQLEKGRFSHVEGGKLLDFLGSK